LDIETDYHYGKWEKEGVTVTEILARKFFRAKAGPSSWPWCYIFDLTETSGEMGPSRNQEPSH